MNTNKSIGQIIKINRLILSMLLIFISFPSYAASNAVSLKQSIHDYVTNYAQELSAKGYRYEVKIGSIDPRLNFGRCQENLRFEFVTPPTSQEQSTIKVECANEQPWKLFVATTLKIFGPSVIASQSIGRNQPISPDMIEIKETQINRAGQASFSDPKSVIGMVAKRTIREGQTIQPHSLSAPRLVNRGDQIVITAKNDMISIKMKGTALSDGTLGEQISVKNNQSKRIVKATIVDTGQVAVNL